MSKSSESKSNSAGHKDLKLDDHQSIEDLETATALLEKSNDTYEELEPIVEEVEHRQPIRVSSPILQNDGFTAYAYGEYSSDEEAEINSKKRPRSRSPRSTQSNIEVFTQSQRVDHYLVPRQEAALPSNSQHQEEILQRYCIKELLFISIFVEELKAFKKRENIKTLIARSMKRHQIRPFLNWQRKNGHYRSDESYTFALLYLSLISSPRNDVISRSRLKYDSICEIDWTPRNLDLLYESFITKTELILRPTKESIKNDKKDACSYKDEFCLNFLQLGMVNHFYELYIKSCFEDLKKLIECCIEKNPFYSWLRLPQLDDFSRLCSSEFESFFYSSSQEDKGFTENVKKICQKLSEHFKINLNVNYNYELCLRFWMKFYVYLKQKFVFCSEESFKTVIAKKRILKEMGMEPRRKLRNVLSS